MDGHCILQFARLELAPNVLFLASYCPPGPSPFPFPCHHRNYVNQTTPVAVCTLTLSRAHQGYGLRAHAKRDTEKSNIYFWGWVVYSTYSFVIELHRLASVDADAAAYENQRCDACMLKFPETASCEDPKVVECVGFAASEHKPSAYMYGVASLLAGLALNGYFCLVARSYWFYLHDDRLAVVSSPP